MSGGGARGAAHIGVLKVLEELRVPIDCIAGTSMGSIVGGAYASGMSIPDMEAMIKDISVSALFSENPPRQDLAIRRKIDDRSILLGLELGLKDGELLLPKGAISGVQLESFLRRLAKVQGYRRFDELPIPFRAVATDLVTGKAVVFSEGELPNVMRASMSVPGAVAPAELNGMILVDGGLTENLPVNVARSMGADVVIAVNLGTPLLTRAELKSVVGVTDQMINILTQQNVDASLALLRPGDVLIEPKLGDFSAADFDHLPKTVPIGEAAARDVEARLRALSVSREDYAALRLRQGVASPPDLRAVDEIRFEDLTRVNPASLERIMQTRPNEPLDQTVLDRDMQRLFGTDDFEHVNYRILDEPGRRVLDVDAVEKSWGPNYVRFGLGLGSDLHGDTFFNLAASYRRTWINSLGAEWRNRCATRADVAARHRVLPARAVEPLILCRAACAARDGPTVDVFQQSEPYRQDMTYAPAARASTWARPRDNMPRCASVLRRAARMPASTRVRPSSRPRTDASTRTPSRARAIFDQLDSAKFPRTGAAATAEIFAPRGTLGADASYTKADIDLIGAYSVDRHTLQAALKIGGPLGSGELPRYDLFQWGGFLQLRRLRPGQSFWASGSPSGGWSTITSSSISVCSRGCTSARHSKSEKSPSRWWQEILTACSGRMRCFSPSTARSGRFISALAGLRTAARAATCIWDAPSAGGREIPARRFRSRWEIKSCAVSGCCAAGTNPLNRGDAPPLDRLSDALA